MSTAKVLTESRLSELMPSALMPRPIPAGPIDLNELTQGGVYMIRESAVTNAPQGAPIPAMVIVLPTTTEGILLQVYVCKATMAVYIRFLYWTWLDWSRV